MDRNTFTGLFLIALILLGFSYFMQPSKLELKREQMRQDSIAASKRGTPISSLPSVIKTENTSIAIDSSAKIIPVGPFSASIAGKEEFITLENDVMKITLSTRGGRIYSSQLKKFKTYFGQPLILLNGPQNIFGLNFTAEGKSINTNNLFFKPTNPAVQVLGRDSSGITLRLSNNASQYIDYAYSLKKGSYLIGFSISAVNLNDVINARNNTVLLRWKNDILPLEKGDEVPYTTVKTRNDQHDIDELKSNKDDTKKSEHPVEWVSFKQKFFSMVLIPQKKFSAVESSDFQEVSKPLVKTLTADIAIPFTKETNQQVNMRIYMGPNDFKGLKRIGVGLEEQIDLGWGPLKLINRFAVIPVFDLLSKLNLNYGIIILILTLLLKAVLFPLTYKSYLSTAKMRIIKPEMDEIKEKIGDGDPTRLQQEYLKLYKKAGVNPLGGCLPMLLQMPILFAFYRFFPNAFELRQQKFLFMEDLSTYDSVIHWTSSIPVFGNHLSIMCVLMAVTTVIYSLLNQQVSPTGPAGNQLKYMSYIFPLFTISFLNNFSSGLNYYYFLANIITFSSQALIRRFVNDDEIHRRIQENKKKPAINKKSKFQAKIEELTKVKTPAQLGTPKLISPIRPSKKF